MLFQRVEVHIHPVDPTDHIASDSVADEIGAITSDAPWEVVKSAIQEELDKAFPSRFIVKLH